VVGFVGAWLQVDEYHVTTLAVHPEWRRQGIGERLMRRLMARAVEIGAEAITLEVRVGNGAARELYAKLGFKEVGLRRRYYADNNEDAVICTIPIAILERFSRRAGEGRASS
jgi:ribosomal-protein-alanine N-acetyltransferase